MYPTRRGGRPSVRRGLVALAAVIVLAGCASGPDPVASFVTSDGPQYFVRPVEFRGVGDTDGSALVDLTVREPRDQAADRSAVRRSEEGSDRTDAAGSADADASPAALPPVQVNFTVPLAAARGLSRAELRTASGARYPLENLERFFARSDTARYGSTMPREQFDRLRATPERVELVISSSDNGGGASAERRYAAAEPWVRRMEILNLMLAE